MPFSLSWSLRRRKPFCCRYLLSRQRFGYRQRSPQQKDIRHGMCVCVLSLCMFFPLLKGCMDGCFSPPEYCVLWVLGFFFVVSYEHRKNQQVLFVFVFRLDFVGICVELPTGMFLCKVVSRLFVCFRELWNTSFFSIEVNSRYFSQGTKAFCSFLCFSTNSAILMFALVQGDTPPPRHRDRWGFSQFWTALFLLKIWFHVSYA